MIGRVVPLDRVPRHAVAAMLANHDRPPLARLQILRQQQNAPGKYVFDKRRAPPRSRSIAADRTPAATGGSAGSSRSSSRPNSSSHRYLRHLRNLRDELLERRLFGIDLHRIEAIADCVRAAHQSLHVIFQLLHLAPLTLAGIEFGRDPSTGLASDSFKGSGTESKAANDSTAGCENGSTGCPSAPLISVRGT